MSRIFINYRRNDSRPYANTLYDWLQERYGEERVFKDVDSIEPGLDFVEAIDRALASTSVMLVVIGRNWLEDSGGRRRLDEPNDYVRTEIAAALEQNVRVIPILVEGAEMPGVDELPEPVVSLARRHAFELNDVSPARLLADKGDLLRRLDLIVGERKENGQPEESGGTPQMVASAPVAQPQPQTVVPQAQPQPVVAPAAEEPDRTRRLVKWGWILAGGSLLIPFAAIASIIMGAMVISRSQGRRTVMGIAMIATAVFLGLIGLGIWANA